MSQLHQLALFCIFLLISCSNKNPKNDGITKVKKIIDTNKEKNDNLISKYNAIDLGNKALKFTYQIQELFSNPNNVLFVKGELTDIILKDDGYYLKIKDNILSKEFLFEILLSNQQFKNISGLPDLDSKLNSGTFIFMPKSAKSSSLLSMEPEVYYGETRDDDEISLTYQFNGTLYVVKGILIDYYLNQRIVLDENE